MFEQHKCFVIALSADVLDNNVTNTRKLNKTHVWSSKCLEWQNYWVSVKFQAEFSSLYFDRLQHKSFFNGDKTEVILWKSFLMLLFHHTCFRWDHRDFYCLHSKWKADRSAVTSLCVSPDGKLLLSAGKIIKMWDLDTKEVYRVSVVESADFSYSYFLISNKLCAV